MMPAPTPIASTSITAIASDCRSRVAGAVHRSIPTALESDFRRSVAQRHDRLAPAPLFAGIEFNWLDRDQVTVNIVNEQATTMTLEVANALQPEVLLPLADLRPDIAAQLPFVAELITEPVTLPPLASQSFDCAADGAQSTDRV